MDDLAHGHCVVFYGVEVSHAWMIQSGRENREMRMLQLLVFVFAAALSPGLEILIEREQYFAERMIA